MYEELDLLKQLKILCIYLFFYLIGLFILWHVKLKKYDLIRDIVIGKIKKRRPYPSREQLH